LVKTSKVERLAENIGLFNFELTEEEIAKIDALDRGMRLFNPLHWSHWANLPYYGD
jgi:D-xylose reductase